MKSRWFFAAIIVLSAICPVINACCVIELLVGISRLKQHYWIGDGVILSVGSNLLVWPFMALARESLGPVKHAIVGLILVNTTSFVAYVLFMAALMS